MIGDNMTLEEAIEEAEKVGAGSGALYAVAFKYFLGRGTPRDRKKASLWFRLAARQAVEERRQLELKPCLTLVRANGH